MAKNALKMQILFRNVSESTNPKITKANRRVQAAASSVLASPVESLTPLHLLRSVPHQNGLLIFKHLRGWLQIKQKILFS